jgi:hypothetical protein
LPLQNAIIGILTEDLEKSVGMDSFSKIPAIYMHWLQVTAACEGDAVERRKYYITLWPRAPCLLVLQLGCG